MIKNVLIFMFIVSNIFALQVGEVSMLRGEAVIQRGSSEIGAKIQTSIEDKDIIKTKKDTKIQLSFDDDTVITLGENSNFEIEKYLYEDKNPNAKFNVTKGSFKVITGKIGKLAPKNFLLKTRTSLIGVRGTIFAGEVGMSSVGGDYIACIKGSILVSSIRSGANYSLNHGEVILIKNDGSMEKVEKIDNQNFTSISHLEKPSQTTQTSSQEQEAPSNEDQVSDNTAQEVVATNIVEVEQESSEDSSREGDIENDSTNPNPVPSVANINQLIDQKSIVNYKGTLNGTSTGKYITSSATTNLKADIQGDVDMRVDFGGNDPLRVDISNQQLSLSEASVNGNAVTGSDFDNIKQTLSSSNQFTTSMQMQQSIDADRLKITGSYSKTENGFTTNSQLDGTFKDNTASGITGTLNESTAGSANGVNIDRTINASFNVNKN